MKFVKEDAGKNLVKFTITLSKEEWADANTKAFEKNKHKFSVEGFRKGKVPRKVLENRYGETFLFEEAIDVALPIYYGKALDESPEVWVVDRPEIDLVEIDLDKLVFTATVTVRPEVKLGAYEGIELKREVEEITDEAVDKEINAKRNSVARTHEVTEGACVSGDTVKIDFAGSIDGELFDGGSAEGYDLELGSNSFIPGFEEQIVGMAIGEEKTIKVTFPENYVEHLAGKDADFAIKLHAITRKELPELDDEFAKDVSEFDTLAEYRDSIKKRLTENAEKRAELKVEDDLIFAIVDNAEVDIPECMIRDQVEQEMQQVKYTAMQYGMTYETYLGMMNTTDEAVREQAQASAGRKIKTSLVIAELMKVADIKVTDEDMDAKVAEIVKASGKDPVEYKKNMSDRQREYIEDELRYNNLIKHLKGLNKIN